MAPTMLVAIALLSTIAIVQGYHNVLPVPHEYVWASSIYYDSSNGLAGPWRAVDGNIDPDFTTLSTFSTGYTDPAPFIDIYLGAYHEVDSVVITNRGDSNPERLHDIDISLYDFNPRTSLETAKPCGTIGTAPAASSNTTVICPVNTVGNYIRIKKTSIDNTFDVLQIVELKIWASPLCY